MAITESDVATVRRFYSAVAAQDLETIRACFAPDVVWHLPGHSPIAGDHHGWDAIRDDFLAKLSPLSGGTFRVELVDVAIGVDQVVAVQHATADHDGRHLDLTACQLVRLEAGRIVEVQGHYSSISGNRPSRNQANSRSGSIWAGPCSGSVARHEPTC